MQNSDLIGKYLKLQSGTIFDELKSFNDDKSVLAYSDVDKSVVWNFSFVKYPLPVLEIKTLEREWTKRKRTPSFYFEDKPELGILKNNLERLGYKMAYKDAWMSFEKLLVLNPEYKVVKVSNEKELKLSLDVCNKCFEKDDPNNPYGEMGDEYLKIISDSWHKHHQTDRIECFIFYKDNEPVAVSQLTNYEGLGYISNVGSLRSVRGQGFGKLATLHAVKRSQELKNKDTFLLTEEDGYPYEFYKRIGFKERFAIFDYSKE